MINSYFGGLMTRKKTRELHRALPLTRKLSFERGPCTSFAQKPERQLTGAIARVTIDMIPDVALLRIFDFYLSEAEIEAWHTLVHVCRGWRSVVFGSPCRLGLRLLCTAGTSVRETLEVWPLLPMVLIVYSHANSDTDNIIAALEHKDRICICDLDFWGVAGSQMGEVLGAMQQPFPAFTSLELRSRDETWPVVPASFLGGTSPRLQRLTLNHIPFPGLPNLLLTATHLVDLRLWRIPHSGFISPEAMVTGLAVLIMLETLEIVFESPRSRPGLKSRRPPPPRALLPVLTKLLFKGAGEYLEEFVARIDAPLLDKLQTTFFHQPIFVTPQLTQFISRTPKFKAHDEAHVEISDGTISVTFPQMFDGELKLEILCRQLDRQLSSLAQACSLSFPQSLIPAVEYLYILEDMVWRPRWQGDIENMWLGLLHPFTAAKALYLSQKIVPYIAPALQGLAKERPTEVLPALQDLFLENTLPSGPVKEAIDQFVAVRLDNTYHCFSLTKRIGLDR